jgi:predicted enzyme related to lactoylglutathione lyase
MGSGVVAFDISGPDPGELHRFYGEVFGWTITPVPGMNYAFVDTGAGSGISGGIGGAQEGPGQVAFYVASDDLQATLDRAEVLGGKTTQPVVVIPNTVSLAMFADPQGHEVGLVGPVPGGREGPRIPSAGSGAPVTWFEVMGPDGESLVAFYSELFGWTAKKYDIPGFDYWEMDTGTGTEAGTGIQGGIGTGAQGQSYTTVYAETPDLEATMEKAGQLGATTVIPPMSMSEGPRIAMFTDPQGHLFGVLDHH